MPSTAVRDIRYDPLTRQLQVSFVASGRRYVYFDVPPEAWEAFRHAFAKGAHFNRHIRGSYASERLEEPAAAVPPPSSPTMP